MIEAGFQFALGVTLFVVGVPVIILVTYVLVIGVVLLLGGVIIGIFPFLSEKTVNEKTFNNIVNVISVVVCLFWLSFFIVTVFDN